MFKKLGNDFAEYLNGVTATLSFNYTVSQKLHQPNPLLKGVLPLYIFLSHPYTLEGGFIETVTSFRYYFSAKPSPSFKTR